MLSSGLNPSKNPREFPRSHKKSGASTVGAEVFDLDLQVVQCPAQVKVEEPFSLELQADVSVVGVEFGLWLLNLKRRGEHGSWRLYGYPWLMNVDETPFFPCRIVMAVTTKMVPPP